MRGMIIGFSVLAIAALANLACADGDGAITSKILSAFLRAVWSSTLAECAGKMTATAASARLENPLGKEVGGGCWRLGGPPALCTVSTLALCGLLFRAIDLPRRANLPDARSIISSNASIMVGEP